MLRGVAKEKNESYTYIYSIPWNINPIFNVQLINADANGNLNLPDARLLLDGISLKFRRIDNASFDVYIVPFPTQTIEGSTNSVSIKPKETVEIIHTNGSWIVKNTKMAVVNTYNDGNAGTTPYNVTNTYDAYVAHVPPATTLTWNLPALSTVVPGKQFTFRNSGTGVISLIPNGTDKIEGNTSYSVSGNNSNITLVAFSNNNWIRTL